MMKDSNAAGFREKALRRIRILMGVATDGSRQSLIEYGLVTTFIALGAAVAMMYVTVAISHMLIAVAAKFAIRF
jgi:hypothetical protein